MKMIQKLVKEIKDELHGAKHYAKKAALYKPENPTLATAYLTMAQDELKHANTLHAEAVKAIEKKRATTTPPQFMLDIWEAEHKDYIENAASIRAMIELSSK